MNIQLYISKQNFDVQKAERYFKERRIKVQVMDLKKHKLGERELQVFARGIGMEALLDKEDKKVASHPASYNSIESHLMNYFIENPWLLRAPIVRNGSKVTIGYQPDVWEQWIQDDK